MVKDMEDGSKAVGLFNMSRAALEITGEWSTLGVTGPQRVRDLWRQKELGVFEESYKASIPRHGVAMLRMWAK